MKTDRAPMQPSISLSTDDIRELRSLSADLERELLRSYEDFLFRDQRRVDDDRWRPVKSFENVHCYRERRSYKRMAGSRQQRPSPAGDDDRTFEIGPQAAMAANNKMPLLFATGKANGSLDDALYGGVFHDTNSLRARNLYLKDEFEGTAVLAAVDVPTQQDPFRFLGVVWYYRSFGPSCIIMSRDAVMLVSIHETRLSNGERVALVLHHSVQHPDAPERRDLSIVRVDVSYAVLFRQLDASRLDIYFTTFVEFKGSATESFTLSEVTRGTLYQTDLCEASFRRKLLHRVRLSRRRKSFEDAVPGKQDDREDCALCDKKTSGLFSSSGSNCRICRQRVCTKCSMTKELVVEDSRTSCRIKSFQFCLTCALETKQLPAATVAREELIERWSGELFSSFLSSSTSSMD